jgi:hypothetical protein
MGLTMLEFSEALLKEIRRLQQDAESLVLNGSVSNMERYRFLMGRLEGLRFAEQAVKDLLSKNKEDF